MNKCEECNGWILQDGSEEADWEPCECGNDSEEIE